MADPLQQDPHDPQPVRGWDYSDHPLHAGGMQIVTVVVSTVLTLIITGALVLLWLWLSPVPTAR